MQKVDLDWLSVETLAQAADIWNAGWKEAHIAIVPAKLTQLRTLDSFRTRLQTHMESTRVATQSGQVLGFCAVLEDELYQMYVAPQARGLGVAQALIRDAETRVHDSGHAKIWLSCAIGNSRAARFYEKSGWANVGTKVANLDTSDGVFPLEVWTFEKQLN